MADSVRIVRAGKQGRKLITRFPSLKMGRMVLGESLLELDYHRLLEFDPDVVSFQEQPFKIEYFVGGKSHLYTPDVLVVRASGARQVIEVKQEKEALEPENKQLYRLAKPICARNGYAFGLALDVEIRREPRLHNVKLLLRYARRPINLSHRLACDSFFATKGQAQTTLRELIDFCRLRNVAPGAVYAMVCRGLLMVNIHQLLEPGSFVCLAGQTLP